MLNPFLINQYISPAYFCDRDQETTDLIDALKSGRSVTIHSIRRMGKTALIKHVYHKLSRNKDFVLIYLDILDISTAKEFINILSSKIITSLEKSREGFIRKVTKYFGKYRPVFSIDSLTGSPSVSLDIRNESDIKVGLETIFTFINEQPKTFVIAIDEFQQVNNFEVKTIPASLRKHLQSTRKLVFIFSGSQRNMLLELMTSPKQALYRSTQIMSLSRIPQEIYAKFIANQFSKNNKIIVDELIYDSITWTMNHTYYTQFYFHRLFSECQKSVDELLIHKLKTKILQENEITFLNYKNLMSKAQWKLLSAIGKEGVVREPTSKIFLQKY